MLSLSDMLSCLQLLRAGAQVHHVSKDGRSTALHEAVLRNHAELAELLLRASANPFLENGSGRSDAQPLNTSWSEELKRNHFAKGYH